VLSKRPATTAPLGYERQKNEVTIREEGHFFCQIDFL